MNQKLFKILFFSVLLLAFLLRTVNLGNVPPGVNQDEASIGYTAYSLINTGKDEYGVTFPLSFQSFGDWKLPVYIYLTVPFVKILGLSEIAVRMPAVIFGFLTVITTYFLVNTLFKNRILALLSMLAIAISPWHIHLSRVESESNIAVFLVAASTLLLFKSFQKSKWLIVPSMLGFALTYYTYAGNYIFTTVFLLGIILFYKIELYKNKFFKRSLIVFAIFFLFISSITVFNANKTKISGTSVFSDPAIFNNLIESPRIDHGKDITSKLLHNKLLLGIERIGHNYINSFSPQFLFISGGTNRAHNIANFGNMYFVEAPFLILGFFTLFLLRRKMEAKFILFWILIAPLAAVITKDAPHTNRMFAIFPALSIVLALGLYEFFRYLKNPDRLKKLIILTFILTYLLNFIIYLDRYHLHFPKNETQNWGNSYKSLINILDRKEYSGKKVVFARPEASHYIFLLFYKQYSPETYQDSVVRYPPSSDKFVYVKRFDRYEFRDIVWSKDLKSKDLLLIDFARDIPPFVREDYKTIDTKLPNGKAFFTIVESKYEKE